MIPFLLYTTEVGEPIDFKELSAESPENWVIAGGIIALVIIVPILFPKIFPKMFRLQGYFGKKHWKEVEAMVSAVDIKDYNFSNRLIWFKHDPMVAHYSYYCPDRDINVTGAVRLPNNVRVVSGSVIMLRENPENTMKSVLTKETIEKHTT